MLMRKVVIISIREATTEAMAYLKDLNSFLIDAHDILHCIVYYWLHNGADLSVSNAIEAVQDHFMSVLEEAGMKEDMTEDDVLSILVTLEIVTELYMKALASFFAIVEKSKQPYPPAKAEICGGNDNDVYIEIVIRRTKRPLDDFDSEVSNETQ